MMRTQSVFNMKWARRGGYGFCVVAVSSLFAALTLLLWGCGMYGTATDTADVTISVSVPDMTAQQPVEARGVAENTSRLFNPDTQTVLVVVVTPGFDGGNYSMDGVTGGPSLSYTEDFFLEAQEGQWTSVSLEGTTFGFAYLMIPLATGNFVASGTITGMPVGAELLFMAANSDLLATDIGDSFAEIMSEINSDASIGGASVLCRGYSVLALAAGENEVFIPLLPTQGNMTGLQDFDLIVTSFGGTYSYLGLHPQAWVLYACTGLAGQAYLVELAADDAGLGDVATLYMFDSMGQTIGTNPRPGNSIEVTFGSFSPIQMPWDDLEESKFYMAIFGHTDGNADTFVPFTLTITER